MKSTFNCCLIFSQPINFTKVSDPIFSFTTISERQDLSTYYTNAEINTTLLGTDLYLLPSKGYPLTHVPLQTAHYRSFHSSSYKLLGNCPPFTARARRIRLVDRLRSPGLQHRSPLLYFPQCPSSKPPLFGFIPKQTVLQHLFQKPFLLIRNYDM